MNQNLVIVAPVWARTPTEAERLAFSLTYLSRLRVPIVLADGGSEPEFVQRVAALPNVTLLPVAPTNAPGLTGQVQRALAYAKTLNPRWLFYTEPDKAEFFIDCACQFVQQVANDEAAVILAGRSDNSFATFPDYQQEVESQFNALASGWLGTDGDLLYGPFLFRAELAHHVTNLTCDLGWGWRTYLFAKVYRQNKPFHIWTEYLPCPMNQRGENTEADQLYRLRQMGQNITGLAQGLR